MTTIHTKMTIEEFLALPETNHITQLIDGDFVVTPPPLDIHQETVGALYLYISRLEVGGKLRLAPTGIYMDNENAVEPDIFWVSAANESCFLRADGRYWQGAPDFIIEVLSPSTTDHDQNYKFQLYEKYGVREYWLVDPESKRIEVYQRENNQFRRAGSFAPSSTFASTALNKVINVTAAFTL